MNYFIVVASLIAMDAEIIRLLCHWVTPITAERRQIMWLLFRVIYNVGESIIKNLPPFINLP